ncbi:MAG: GTPase HflX, partial [Candidatus Eremiobacteraeota bacterium]|nr:GTPase HflX [Candidatus Eremiobacteraeota bacterium]
LETDRRHVLRRISTLRRELEKLEKHRNLLRKRRRDRGYTLAAIIGYTNAGKSTLLNALTSADVLAEDRLFATLDPTTRKLHLPGGGEVLLVDTVGLIRNLPHELVAAFHATLEEVAEADILIHVMDSSHPRIREQVEVVYNVLEDMAADNKPLLSVLNKVDLITKKNLDDLIIDFPDAVIMSALKNIGRENFLQALKELMEGKRDVFTNMPEHEGSGRFGPTRGQKKSIGSGLTRPG